MNSYLFGQFVLIVRSIRTHFGQFVLIMVNSYMYSWFWSVCSHFLDLYFGIYASLIVNGADTDADTNFIYSRIFFFVTNVTLAMYIY